MHIVFFLFVIGFLAFLFGTLIHDHRPRTNEEYHAEIHRREKRGDKDIFGHYNVPQ